MTDAEIFSIETHCTGGRVPYEQLPERIREAYVEVAERAEDLIDCARRDLPELPSIHFDFIRDKQVNALAFKTKHRYFIGLTSGTLYMLRMVVGRMLSDQRTFVAVGQPNREVADLPPLSHYICDAEAMADQRMTLLTPNDSARARFAQFLEDQAIMFLLGHEIGHITRGHVDYLATQGGAGFKAQLEWLWNNSSAARTLERQCLEMDADRHSIASRIASLRLTHSNLRKGKPMPPWSPDSYEIGPMIRDWSASFHLLFRLFGDVRFSRSELNRLMYPPLPVRRALCDMWAWGFIQDTWDPTDPTLKEVVAKALLHGRSEVEYAFADILGEQVSTEGLKTAMGKTGQDHMHRLLDHWNASVVELVKPFSYEF